MMADLASPADEGDSPILAFLRIQMESVLIDDPQVVGSISCPSDLRLGLKLLSLTVCTGGRELRTISDLVDGANNDLNFGTRAVCAADLTGMRQAKTTASDSFTL